MKIDKNLKDLIFNFFENEEDPIFIFKITANREEFYYANPSFYNILGYTEKDVKYLKFYEIYNNVENKLKSNFIDNIKKNKSIVISTFLIKKDGSTFPALIKFYLYKQDNENFLMAFCKNQIEKSIIEYRKYISDFLLRNFQKDNIETDLILKVAESISFGIDSFSINLRVFSEYCI